MNTYTQLSQGERYQIYALKQAGHKHNEIAALLGPHRVYLRACPNDYRASPSIAGLPHRAGLVPGSCSSSPRFALRLPSDPASRRTPLGGV